MDKSNQANVKLLEKQLETEYLGKKNTVSLEKYLDAIFEENKVSEIFAYGKISDIAVLLIHRQKNKYIYQLMDYNCNGIILINKQNLETIVKIEKEKTNEKCIIFKVDFKNNRHIKKHKINIGVLNNKLMNEGAKIDII